MSFFHTNHQWIRKKYETGCGYIINKAWKTRNSSLANIYFASFLLVLVKEPVQTTSVLY
jgi:hypothetical protein